MIIVSVAQDQALMQVRSSAIMYFVMTNPISNRMKRAVLCVPNPQDYIDQLDGYSIMIINPASSEHRKQYLLDHADWSLKITDNGEEFRTGADYPNERLFWYTSGTTGDSKFCSFSQQQLDIMCKTICSAYDISANDRYVSVMPLWHAHGQGMYWATKHAGCETNFVSVNNTKQIPKHAPTFVSAIPDFLKVIANLKLQNLRFVRSASAPLGDDLYNILRDKFGVPVIEAFGMTEALSHCFTNPLHGEQRVGTVGRPDGIHADIVDGELYIKGPCLFTQDWYNTGDLACVDQSGYYKIIGRSRDQISVRGIKLNPASLESQLRQNINELEDCVIFGSNSIKVLFVGTCSAAAIDQYLRSLGSHCRAESIDKVDHIPVSPSGKISRSWLDKNH